MRWHEPVLTRIGLDETADNYRFLAIFDEKESVNYAKIFINDFPEEENDANLKQRTNTYEITPFEMCTFEISIDSRIPEQEQTGIGDYRQYGIIGAENQDVLTDLSLSDIQDEALHEFKPMKESGPEVIGLATCNGGGYSKKVPNSVRNFVWKKMGEKHTDKRTNPEDFDLLVLAGDQIYGDPLQEQYADGEIHRENLVEAYRKRYVNIWSQPEIKDVLASVPTIMMWNDHDIFNGYGSYSDENDQNIREALFDAAAKSYDEFQGSVNPDPINSGIARAYSLETDKAAFLVADCRTNRNYDEGIILGQTQLKGFYEEADRILNSEEPPEHVFLVLGIPFFHFGRKVAQEYHQIMESAESWLNGLVDLGLDELETDFRDGWVSDKNKPEFHLLMDKILDVFSDYEGKVTILSGDVHLSTVAELTPQDERDLTLNQVTSSPIGYAPQGKMGTAGEYMTDVSDELEFSNREFPINKDDSLSLDSFTVNCDLKPLGEHADILARRNYAVLDISNTPGKVDYYFEKNMKNNEGQNQIHRLEDIFSL